ncbi:MAG: LuxR C-terminal-related transcriptional regulator [Anaerolineae bacterium]|nr:LuxR C-terminal-related transcriptional regulator [Anaerolineae bacterium]
MGTFDENAQVKRGIESLFPSLPVPPTPLVGRQNEVATATDLLRRADVRLVTLTGPPGVGKTRLALEIANRLLTHFTDGVYFINLAPIAEFHLVLPTIAHTLGFRQVTAHPLIEELKYFLVNQRVLLVLDNFEQVIQAAPALTDLLQATLHLKILVTSRELLRVSGEHIFPVPTLPLPPVLVDQRVPRVWAALPPERLIDYGAVKLFVQCAVALQPDFALTPDNALIVAGICCRLDGLPLAIELAAARIRHLPPQEIYDRLEHRLHLLTGGARDLPLRQHTLRAAIEWSYNLLETSERLLFARLAVFSGGCSLEAAEAVCAEALSIPVFDGLASLVDKSLVQRKATSGGATRFVLLEMMHEYARELLQASGELDTLRRQHAVYFRELAERAEIELRLAHQKYWFHLLDTEIDNLRAALEWSLESGDVTVGICIMSGTFLYWIVYSRQDEGIQWTQSLLVRIDEVVKEYQIHLLRSAAPLIAYRDLEAASRLAQQAVAIAREYGDKRQLGWSLWALSTTLARDSEAEAWIQEALVLFREVGDQPGLGLVYNSMGERARLRGDDVRARSAYEESLAIAERTGDARRQYYVLFNLAFVAQHEGNHQDAIRLILRSLALCQDLGVPTDVAQELLALAGSLGALGEPEKAARLFGAAHTFLERSGALIDPSDQPEHDRNIAFVRTQLGEAAYEAAWAEGQAMTLDQAVAYAQTVPNSDELPVSRPRLDQETQRPSGLTRRELEVALLITEGKSNREIADAFVIAERTVEGHVSNILSKLGFRSRAQVSAWVVKNALSDR